VQALRIGLALALTGCVQFDRPPEKLPDARPPTDGATDDGPETLSQAADRVITTWQSCLTIDDIDQSGLAAKWPAMLAETSQSCEDCHGTGSNGFIATFDKSVLGVTLKSDRNYLLQYLTVDLTRGAAGAAMVINAAIQEAVSQAQPPHATHPRFDPTEGLLASEALRRIVQERLDDGLCPD
jgi:hypothetical protein